MVYYRYPIYDISMLFESLEEKGEVMLEKIKENLFLLLIALFMVGSIGVYIFSTNQYKVNSLTSGNKDVIASIDKLKIYADNF